jgi:serine/alanine adding enzyme
VINHTQVSIEYWQAYADVQEYGTIFHTPFIHRIYESAPLHKPFAFFSIDSNDQIHAMLQGFIQTVKRGLSAITNRIVVFQSPIYDKDEALNALLQYFNSFASKHAIYSEIRNHYNQTDKVSLYCKIGFTWEDHLDILINIDKPADDIFNQMANTRRKQVNRGNKRGAIASLISSQDRESLLSCYNMIINLYHRINLPAPDWQLFDSAFTNSNSKTAIKCFALIFEGKIIGTRIVLCYKDRIYDWYAGSLAEHYDKYPNDILVWEVLKWGQNTGYKVFDFGGAGKPDVPYGVRDYKLKFGGDLVNFGRYKIIHAPFRYKIAHFGLSLLQSIRRKKQ